VNGKGDSSEKVGNLSTNRPHNLQANWSYELPMASPQIGKVLGAIVNHWTFSGIDAAVTTKTQTMALSPPRRGPDHCWLIEFKRTLNTQSVT
jgi:hypothetical protein